MSFVLASVLATGVCLAPPRRAPAAGWLPSVDVVFTSRSMRPAGASSAPTRRTGVDRGQRAWSVFGLLRWDGIAGHTRGRSLARVQAALASCATMVLLAPSAATAATPSDSTSSEGLRAVLEAVRRAAPDPARLHGTARRSAWMPAIVRAEVRWDDGARENNELRISQDYDEGDSPDGSDIRDTTSWLDDRGRVFRIQVGWDLRGAVFPRETLAIASAVRASERELLGRLERAAEAWATMLARCAVPEAAPPEQHASATLEWVIAEQTLSVLTGGWYAVGDAGCVGSEVALTR